MKYLALLSLLLLPNAIAFAAITGPSCIETATVNSGSAYATINGIQNDATYFYGAGIYYPYYGNSVAGNTIAPTLSLSKSGDNDFVATAVPGDVVTFYECGPGDAFGSAGGVIGCHAIVDNSPTAALSTVEMTVQDTCAPVDVPGPDIPTNPVVWSLSALALSGLYALAAFGVITFMFTIIAWPLMFFAKALYRVILGWHI